MAKKRNDRKAQRRKEAEARQEQYDRFQAEIKSELAAYRAGWL